MMFDAAALKKMCPTAKAPLINIVLAGRDDMLAADINTPRRVACFLATIATETGGLRTIDENLSYSAKRMTQVWPKRFPTISSAQPYANNPQKLAEKVYGGRLGNTRKGDGYRYRGRGFVQTTGRDNYRAAGHEDDPDTLAVPGPAFDAALKFWTDNHLNSVADTNDDKAMRKAVNGGYTGFKEFKDYLALAPKKLASSVPPADPAPAPRPSGRSLLEVQERLKALNYYPTGRPDGLMGPLTEEAILAFRNDNNLPIDGKARDYDDQDFIDCLFLTAEPRRMSEERENATLSDLRAAGSRIVKGSDVLKTTGVIAAGTSAVAGGAQVTGVADAPIVAPAPTTLDQAVETAGKVGEIARTTKEAVSPIRELINEAAAFLAAHWWIPIAIIGIIMVIYGAKIANARLQDFQKGKAAA